MSVGVRYSDDSEKCYCPDEVWENPQEIVELDYFVLNHLPDEFLLQLPKLRSLHFSMRYSKECPETPLDWMSKLTNLEELYLHSDEDDFPSWIGDLKNLKILKCKGFRLSSLPDSIKGLNNLKKLKLVY